MERRDPYQPAFAKARQDLARLDPLAVALASGAELRRGPQEQVIGLAYWGRALAVLWPAGVVRAVSGERLSAAVQLVVLHYLVTADGSRVADRWLSFRELPDGRVYDAAFRRRACLPLARV